MNIVMLAHTRKIFDADLQDLARMVAEMGGFAERQISQAIEALRKRNIRLAHQIIDRDLLLMCFRLR